MSQDEDSNSDLSERVETSRIDHVHLTIPDGQNPVEWLKTNQKEVLASLLVSHDINGTMNLSICNGHGGRIKVELTMHGDNLVLNAKRARRLLRQIVVDRTPLLSPDDFIDVFRDAEDVAVSDEMEILHIVAMNRTKLQWAFGYVIDPRFMLNPERHTVVPTKRLLKDSIRALEDVIAHNDTTKSEQMPEGAFGDVVKRLERERDVRRLMMGVETFDGPRDWMFDESNSLMASAPEECASVWRDALLDLARHTKEKLQQHRNVDEVWAQIAWLDDRIEHFVN